MFGGTLSLAQPCYPLPLKAEKRYVRLTFLHYLPIRGIIGNYKKLIYRLTPRRFASNVKVFHSKDGRLFLKDDVLFQKDGRLLKLQKGKDFIVKAQDGDC